MASGSKTNPLGVSGSSSSDGVEVSDATAFAKAKGQAKGKAKAKGKGKATRRQGDAPASASKTEPRLKLKTQGIHKSSSQHASSSTGRAKVRHLGGARPSKRNPASASGVWPPLLIQCSP